MKLTGSRIGRQDKWTYLQRHTHMNHPAPPGGHISGCLGLRRVSAHSENVSPASPRSLWPHPDAVRPRNSQGGGCGDV